MSFNATCSKIEHCLSKSKFEQRQLFTKETQSLYTLKCGINVLLALSILLTLPECS